jgi:hypothetical protein
MGYLTPGPSPERRGELGPTLRGEGAGFPPLLAHQERGRG